MSGKFRIEVEEAVALIAERMPSYATEKVPLAASRGAILRQAVYAERDQPPFDRVTMDGIAIRYSEEIREFEVRGVQGAGAPAMRLVDPADCVEIMTGAILPVDADTVIPVERIQQMGDLAILEKDYFPQPGQFIHRRASDHRQGDILLEPGMEIGAPEMAVLTIGGRREVEVARWPAVAVISTGDELVDAGEPITDFQIRSSNGPSIAAALEQRGCMNSTQCRLPDDPEKLLAEISRLHQTHEVLILSGGVSMGKYDYVPRILSELDVELVFHKILQRPGLPMWFGVSAENKPIFALPVNPVASLVCLIRFALPAMRSAMGAGDEGPPMVKLAEPIEFTPDLACFMPVKLSCPASGDIAAMPRPTNTSGDFVSLAGTDGFVELKRGRDEYPAGYPAALYRW